MMRFAIDERSLILDGMKAELAGSTLRDFLSNVSAVAAAGHRICYDDELFSIELRESQTFWMLFDSKFDLGLSHEDVELAAALFGSMSKWYEVSGPQPDRKSVV